MLSSRRSGALSKSTRRRLTLAWGVVCRGRKPEQIQYHDRFSSTFRSHNPKNGNILVGGYNSRRPVSSNRIIFAVCDNYVRKGMASVPARQGAAMTTSAVVTNDEVSKSLLPKEMLLERFEDVDDDQFQASFLSCKVSIPPNNQQSVDGDEEWWTCAFIDPITGKSFRSDSLDTCPSHVKMLQLVPQNENSQSSFVCFNDRLWAEHAAAARALDFFSCPIDNVSDNTQQSSPSSPKYWIQQYFLSKHQIPSDSLKQAFQSRSIRDDDDTGLFWWTSTFTNPLTDETFPSGTLLNCPHHVTNTVLELTETNDDNEPIHVIAYNEKKWAEQAAAGRAADCLRHRERRNASTTLSSPNETTKQHFQELSNNNPLCQEDPSQHWNASSIEIEFPKSHPVAALKAAPKQYLSNFYEKYDANSSSASMLDKSYISQSIFHGEPRAMWWTSTFIEPTTLHSFPSGTLRNVPLSVESRHVHIKRNEHQTSSENILAPHPILAISPDDRNKYADDDISTVVCYNSRKWSEQAAAARAYDYLMFRNLSATETTISFCSEEPYESDQTRNFLVLGEIHTKGVDEETVGQDEQTGSLGTNFDTSTQEDDDKQTSESYSIQHVPGNATFYNHPQNTSLGYRTTLGRIMEIWTDGIHDQSSSLPSSPLSNESSLLPTSQPTLDSTGVNQNSHSGSRQQALSNALQWYFMIENDGDVPSHLRQPWPSVHSCNAILDVLSKSTPSDLQSRPELTEKQAKVFPAMASQRIMHRMIRNYVNERNLFRSKEKAIDENGPDEETVLRHKPNTASFNAFMRCRRFMPRNDAEDEERFLRRMIKGDSFSKYSFTLPPPNIETFNIVLERWSVVPECADRYAKLNEIYQLLFSTELPSTTNTTPNGQGDQVYKVRPNRRTFFLMLSNLAAPTENGYPSFNADEARRWIQEMSQIAESDGDDSLRPDVEAYNAAMRSNGYGSQQNDSISNWDDYSTLFQNGFLTSSPAEDEARKLEEWLLDMEQQSIEKGRPDLYPNVHTYEAVIQALVRTGTLDGVLRAESWASRAISATDAAMSQLSSAPLDNAESDAVSSLPFSPRSQTFHPIIAAWVFCGNETGPKRVDSWVEKLVELSETFPLMTPDRLIRESPIFARRNYQRRLCDHLGKISKQSSEDATDLVATSQMIFAAAKECSNCLENLVSMSMSQNAGTDFWLDSMAFEYVMDAWKDVAIVSAKYDFEMEAGKGNIPPSVGLNAMLWTVQVFNDVVNNAETNSPQQDRVYATAISHLNELDLVCKEYGLRQSIFETHLSDVERMIRKSISMDLPPPDYDISYDGNNNESVVNSKLTLFKKCLEGCKTLASKTCYGDAVRLAFLIADYIDANKEQFRSNCTFSGIVFGSISRLITAVVPNKFEEAELRDRVRQKRKKVLMDHRG